MLISRETDYALRILRALLDGELHTVPELTQTQLLPQAFTYKIIKKLSAAGLVEIVRGAAGGCRLSADLAEASLLDLVRGMEERGEVSACMAVDYVCSWRQAHGGCTIHCQLREIQQKLDQELQSHSLLQILKGRVPTTG